MIHKHRLRSTLALEILESRDCPSGFSLVDLGGLPGLAYKDSVAYGMNDLGDVVGRSQGPGGTEGSSRYPVLWHLQANGQYQIINLGLLGGPNMPRNAAEPAHAFDINNRGEIVGLSKEPSGDTHFFLVRPLDTDGDARPDLWFRDSNNDGINDLMIDLNTLPGGADVGAIAINDAGQFVGDAANRSTTGLGQLDAAGNLITNSSFGGHLLSDINGNGQIVGDAYRWQVDSAGTIISGPTSLGTALPGYVGSGYAINSAGTLVAGGGTISTGQEHALLWENSQMKDLGTLGGPNSRAAAVNDAGQVVGRADTKRQGQHAFLWQTGTMTDLNSVLPRGSAWVLQSAEDVNASGRVAGNGVITVSRSRIESHAFVLVPTTAALVAEQAGTDVDRAALHPAQLQPIVAEALARWNALGAETATLRGVDFRVQNLPGKTLGLASGRTVLLDSNAAGWGWFVDASPSNDSEFATSGNQGEQSRMDLLTVVMHELGHLLGHDHDEEGVMAETLAAGVRRTGLEDNDRALSDHVFGQSSDHRADAWLAAWLNEQFDSAHGRAKRRR